MTAIRKEDNRAYEFADLQSIPKKVADEIRPFFQKIDLEKYKKWLEMMYYYTYGSEEKGIKAGQNSLNDDLKIFFIHMAREERWHYILAEKDLQAFDYKIDIFQDTPEVISKYNEWWSAQYGNTTKFN
jgi:hypothetical protein